VLNTNISCSLGSRITIYVREMLRMSMEALVANLLGHVSEDSGSQTENEAEIL
jgi:hypothetical protein